MRPVLCGVALLTACAPASETFEAAPQTYVDSEYDGYVDDDDCDHHECEDPSMYSQPTSVSWAIVAEFECDPTGCSGTLTLTTNLWRDAWNGQPLCAAERTTAVRLEPAEVKGCDDCGGELRADPDGWTLVSDPAVDYDACADWHWDGQWRDLFEEVRPAFDRAALLGASAHQESGWDYLSSGGRTADELTAEYAEFGLVYAGLLLWDGEDPDSFAGMLAEAPLFETLGDRWVPGMILYRPTVDEDGPTLGGGSTFLLNVGY